MLRRRRHDPVDIEAVRSAVKRIVESDRFDGWLTETPDHVLVQMSAPLEMLGFHHFLTPPQDRLLVRAARVVWDAVAGLLDDCPDDLAAAFAALGASLADRAPEPDPATAGGQR
ncbi:hypothetical protein [Streptomyces sp. NPDC053755]|uniref:hypothetical protein n=1 Tax=Streptomyces sp. NPDC053755 TaxID=3155815 RepID=UPI00343DECA5